MCKATSTAMWNSSGNNYGNPFMVAKYAVTAYRKPHSLLFERGQWHNVENFIHCLIWRHFGNYAACWNTFLFVEREAMANGKPDPELRTGYGKQMANNIHCWLKYQWNMSKLICTAFCKSRKSMWWSTLSVYWKSCYSMWKTTSTIYKHRTNSMQKNIRILLNKQ